MYILLGLTLVGHTGIAQPKPAKTRTIITTDGEVDDQDSFIRTLLYTNEFDVIGLVYSSSQWHYTGDGKGTPFTSEMAMTKKLYGERTELRWPGTDWMQEFIDQYAAVYKNLTQHAAGYPSPAYLKGLVKVGNIEFEGEMEKDTEGSEFIKKILLDDTKDPVYLQIWRGTNAVARALKSIEDEYKNTREWPAIEQKVSDKAILYAVLDQDATYKKYVAPHWPKIKVLYNSAQFWNFAYPWPRVVPAEPERGQQPLVLPEEFPGDQGPDADHLEPVIGIGDHVGVLMENVEDGKAVRGEGADSARRLVPVEMPLSLEPLMAVSQPRGPHPDEVIGHRVLGALRAVRVDGHGPGGLADHIGRAAALQPSEIEIRLVIDAPHTVCEQVTADVVIERLVGVHVGNGREGAPVVGELGRLDRQRALLQRPVGPHRPGCPPGTARLRHRDRVGQVQPGPQVTDPRAGRNHQLIARDGALIGLDRGHRVP